MEKGGTFMPLESRPMRESILTAAVQLFAEYGYHAAPLRDIARLAGIQAASIYHHYPNKQSLLVEIMEVYMKRLNTQLEHIIQEYQNPLRCLQEAIANHIRLHTAHKAEFFIINTEIRALEGENRTYILTLRDTYEILLQEILNDGMTRGMFRRSDSKVVSYAIIAMCTEVATWFRPDGRLTTQQVVTQYCQIITQGILVPEYVQKEQEGAHTT